MSVISLNRLVLLAIAVAFTLFAQPERIVVDNLADLQACVDRPAGPPLVCALRNSCARLVTRAVCADCQRLRKSLADTLSRQGMALPHD
jgi:hypothetical protein